MVSVVALEDVVALEENIRSHESSNNYLGVKYFWARL